MTEAKRAQLLGRTGPTAKERVAYEIGVSPLTEGPLPTPLALVRLLACGFAPHPFVAVGKSADEACHPTHSTPPLLAREVTESRC
jgi:hypothetical protein